MADSDDSAPAARDLTMQLPVGNRLLALGELVDVLCADDSSQCVVWFLRVLDAANGDRLIVRHENGHRVKPGAADRYFLVRDVGTWLEAEGWAVTHDDVSEAAPASGCAITTPPEDNGHVRKLDEQEARILEVMHELGLNPLALEVAPGKLGPKNRVRKECLKNAKAFTRVSFEKAWQRLRDSCAILDAPAKKSR